VSDEIKDLCVEEVKLKLLIREAIREELREHYCTTKEHQEQHFWMGKWIMWQDQTKSYIGKYVIGLIIAVIGTLMLYGFILFGKAYFK